MKKLIAALSAGLFMMTLLIPINSFAGEEIQLAAALGSNNSAVAANESSGGAITGGGAGGGGAAVAAGATSTVQIATYAVAIGVGVAGVVQAAKDVESTSNH